MAKRDLREDETRAAERGMEYINDNHLTVPRELRREGYEYHWASSAIGGEIDHSLEQLLRKFWDLVPADRSKGFNRDPLKRNPLSDKWICYQSSVLMERPEAYRSREREYKRGERMQVEGSLEGVENDYSNVFM